MDNLAQLRLEAEIEHPVGLIQDEECGALQVRGAAIDHVQQSPRRRDRHLHAVLQVALLRAFRYAAVHCCILHTGRAAEAVALAFDLQRELARRCKHQRDRTVPRLQDALRDYVHNRRQSETERLAGACRGESDHVATAESNWPRLALDDGGLWEAGGLQLSRDQLGEGRLKPRAHWLRAIGVVVVVLAWTDANALLETPLAHLAARERTHRGVLHVQILLHTHRRLDRPPLIL